MLVCGLISMHPGNRLSFYGQIELLLYGVILEYNVSILPRLRWWQVIPDHIFHSFSQWERRFSRWMHMGVSLHWCLIVSGQLLMRILSHHIRYGRVFNDPAFPRLVLPWISVSLCQRLVGTCLSIQTFVPFSRVHSKVWLVQRSFRWITNKSFWTLEILALVWLWWVLASLWSHLVFLDPWRFFLLQ